MKAEKMKTEKKILQLNEICSGDVVANKIKEAFLNHDSNVLQGLSFDEMDATVAFNYWDQIYNEEHVREVRQYIDPECITKNISIKSPRMAADEHDQTCLDAGNPDHIPVTFSNNNITSNAKPMPLMSKNLKITRLKTKNFNNCILLNCRNEICLIRRVYIP